MPQGNDGKNTHTSILEELKKEDMPIQNGESAKKQEEIPKILDDSKILQIQMDTMELVEFAHKNPISLDKPRYKMQAPNGITIFASKPFPNTSDSNYEVSEAKPGHTCYMTFKS